MISKRKSAAVFHFYFLIAQIKLKEIADHMESFCCSHNSSIRINFQKIGNICSMVRLHMLYDEIIRSTSLQNLLDIIKPLMSKICIYSVHNCYFFIKNNIRIIGHSVWNFILSFEKVYLVIVYAYIFDGICYFHSFCAPLHGV